MTGEWGGGGQRKTSKLETETKTDKKKLPGTLYATKKCAKTITNILFHAL